MNAMLTRYFTLDLLMFLFLSIILNMFPKIELDNFFFFLLFVKDKYLSYKYLMSYKYIL